MLTDVSHQETKPLLESSKPTVEKSTTKYTKSKILFSLLILTAAIIGVLLLSNGGSINKNKKFIFNNEWSSLETIATKYLPKKWSFHSLCDDNEFIELTFAIKQQNIDLIHDKIYEVSNPRSEKFGKHWTMNEIHDLLKPKDDSLDMMIEWFNYYNIETTNIEYLTLNKDFIRIKTTIAIANEMLNTEYSYWINEDGTKQVRVKEDYYVPTSIAEHLDFISPTLRFPPRRHTKTIEKIDNVKNLLDDNSITYNTPSRIRSLYQMNDYIDSAGYKGHYQAIASFLEEWFTNSDIETFWEYFDIETVDLIRVPANQPEGDGDEAELDIEYITSTGNGIDTYVWDIEDDLYFITLIKQIADSGSPPSVVSMSYGGDEQSSGSSYCNRANIEFAKIGLCGVTLFASSGDDGVAGDSDSCSDEYYPSFPASSPYVVAVGGTTGGSIPADEDTDTEETAWIDSGGGFSVYFERQSWQDDAVNDYFDTVSSYPSTTKYNSLGRGYPDISAQAVYYIICVSGEYWSVSGTSCSSPSVAGMFSLINDVRLQNGKTRLGWILPSLYALYKNESYYFNDITEGYNLGCSVDDYIGFSASANWDPVTGLGTLKYPRLFTAFYNL